MATSVAKQLGIEPDRSGWATFKTFEIEGGVVLHDAKGRVETPFQLEGMNGFGLAGALSARDDRLQHFGTIPSRLRFHERQNDLDGAGLSARRAVRPWGRGSAGARCPRDGHEIPRWIGRKESRAGMGISRLSGDEFADKDGGVEITAVLPDSPAQREG